MSQTDIESPQQVPVEPARARLILGLLLGVQFLIALDFSVLNVALPTIGKEIGFSTQNLQWVATAFALTATGFTLFFGRVADLVGRRRIFLAGIVLLGLASALGAACQSPAPLLLARVLQGLATAMVVPSGLALLTTSFPEGPQRDRALGFNGALLSAGFTSGALLGGLLTGFLSWRWAFIINIPVCLVVLILTPRLIPDGRADHRARLDVPGALTVTGGLVALVYGVTRTGQHGWSDPLALICLAAAAVLLVALWMIEARSPEPLISVGVLTRPAVLWGNVGGFVSFSMFTAQVFLLTLYLQRVLGYSPAQTGLIFSVLGTTAFIAGVVAPRVIGFLGDSRRALWLSLAAQAVTTGVLVFVGDTRASLSLVLVATAIGGFVHCLAVVSFMVTATSGLPNSAQGLATGLASMTQQVGITLGIPVMSAIATAKVKSIDPLGTAPAAMLAGTTTTLAIDAAVVAVTAVVVAVQLRRRRVSVPVPAPQRAPELR